MKPHRRLFLFVPLAGALVLSTGVLKAGEPFGVPSTDKLLELEISLPEGKTARVWAREGSMITVQGRLGGVDLHHGFVPVRDRQSVRILPMNLGEDLKSAEQCSEPFAVDGIKGNICGIGNLGVSFKGYTTGHFRHEAQTDPLATLSPTELEQVYGKAGGGVCCVTCDGFTVCASRVKLNCGSCDCGGGGGGFPAV